MISTISLSLVRIQELRNNYPECDFDYSKCDGYKFLLVGDVLVVGDVWDHGYLYAYWRAEQEDAEALETLRQSTPAIKEYVEGIRHSCRWQIRAAGEISWDGKMEKWSSVGFDVRTPFDLRATLEQMLKEFVRENGWLKDPY